MNRWSNDDETGCSAVGGGDNVAKDGRGCVIVGYVDMQYS